MVSGLWRHAPKPEQRRVDTYSGTTDANGNFTVVFAKPFAAKPSIVASIETSGSGYTYRITSASKTGFTVNVQQRAAVTVLTIQVVGFTSTPVAGVTVSTIVTEVI